MSDTPDDDLAAGAEPLGTAGPGPEDDGPLRIFSEQLGVDFDAVVKRAKEWVAQNPLPPDLGPEPFNVGKPRPPADIDS